MIRRPGSREREILWIGSSFTDFHAFSLAVRKESGYQLHRVQNDLLPEDWKALAGLGIGVCERRLRDSSGISRVMYVAKFDEKIYVLQCFQKKNQRTSSADKEITRARYTSVQQHHRSQR
ncbi:MAG TPA: type II toxin-antitoxin system RelE/ParE family toxin [Buttiauxella sp.]|jgi:phage-related protein